MELRHLEEFIVLAQVNNFHRAAEELYITQPTLSNHIQALENELGFELIDRGNGNRLTEAGTALYWDVLEAVGLLNESIQRCTEIARLAESSQGRTVKIVANRMYDCYFTLQDSAHAMEEPVDIAFLDYDMSQPTLSPLTNGNVDIVAIYDVPEIRREAERSGLECVPAGSESFAVFFSRENPIASGELTYENVASATVVERRRYAIAPWKTAIRDMLGRGVNIATVRDSESEAAIGRDIGDNLTVTVTKFAKSICSCNPDITFRTTIDGHPIEHAMMLVYDPKTAPEQVTRFIEHFKEMRS